MALKSPFPPPPPDSGRPAEPALDLIPNETAPMVGARAADLESAMMDHANYLMLRIQAHAYIQPGPSAPPPAECALAMQKSARSLASITASIKRIHAVYRDNAAYTESREAGIVPRVSARYRDTERHVWRQVNGDPQAEAEAVQARMFESLDRFGAEVHSTIAGERRYQQAMEAELRRLRPDWPDRDTWHHFNPPPDEVPEEDRRRFTDAWRAGMQEREDQFGAAKALGQTGGPESAEQIESVKSADQFAAANASDQLPDWRDTSHLPTDLETKSALPPPPAEPMRRPRGAPPGNRNAWKTGRHSAAARRLRAQVRRDARAVRILGRLAGALLRSVAPGAPPLNTVGDFSGGIRRAGPLPAPGPAEFCARHLDSVPLQPYMPAACWHSPRASANSLSQHNNFGILGEIDGFPSAP